MYYLKFLHFIFSLLHVFVIFTIIFLEFRKRYLVGNVI